MCVSLICSMHAIKNCWPVTFGNRIKCDFKKIIQKPKLKRKCCVVHNDAKVLKIFYKLLKKKQNKQYTHPNKHWENIKE